MEENNSNPNYLCKQGCGFYGSTQFEGMCSKCYADSMERVQDQQLSPSPIPTSTATQTPKSAKPGLTNNLSSVSDLDSSTTSTKKPDSPSILPPGSHKRKSSSSSDVVSPLSGFSSTDVQIDNLHADTLSTASSPQPHSAPASVKGEAPSPAPSESSNSSLNGMRKVNRCHFCRKKVGLTGFSCRCGEVFCCLHRYSDKHNCKFDYLKAAQDEIRQSNPEIRAAKVRKI